MNNKLKQKIFNSTFKKPIASVIVILFIASILITILYTVEVSESKNFTGQLFKIRDDEILIKVNAKRDYLNKIRIGDKLLWYLHLEGKRYNGKIIEVKDKSIIIRPDQEDINNLSSQEVDSVKVELFLREEKIIDRIMKKAR